MSRKMTESFSYASNLIDGDDLVVLSRTSVGGASQHDLRATNLVTCHRVRGFRDLAFDLSRDFTR